MKPPKHLVLEEDVHRALRKKKTETGITVKDLGNCVLRSVLERPLLIEAIGAKLVADGLLDEEQFDAIRAAALEQICTSAADAGSIVQPTARNTMASGSWEMRELSFDPDNKHQVLSAWVKDHRMRPIKMHKHAGVEFLNLLSGSVLLTIDIESQILTAPATVTIPASAFHSVTPLERETRMIAVISPHEPGYRLQDDE